MEHSLIQFYLCEDVERIKMWEETPLKVNQLLLHL